MEGLKVQTQKLKCIEDPYEIWGDYNSDKTANVQAVFVKCNPEKRLCKKEEEINEWLKFKYLIVLHNQQNFLHSIDDPDSRLIQNSFITYHPVDPNVR